jgi:hypothetical protein
MGTQKFRQSTLPAARRALRRVLRTGRLPVHVVRHASARVRAAMGRLAAGARRLSPGRVGVASRLGDGEEAVRGPGGWRVAAACDVDSADELAAANLVEVIDALAAAGVRCFVTDPSTAASHRLGVFAEDRRRAMGALRATGLELAPGRRGRHTTVDRLGSLATAPRWWAWRYVHLGGGTVAGVEHGVEIELWEEGATGRRVPDGRSGIAEFAAERDVETTVEVRGRSLPTYGTFAADIAAGAVTFPVDVVYTWVDGSDPEWRRQYREHVGSAEGLSTEAASASRYTTRDELRYSMRSLWWNADFVRHVYLVTWGHVPDWLVTGHPRLSVVPHEEIIDPANLPTFNSHAIESRLHHIEGLSEHYLYANDDMLFARPLHAGAFFTAQGLARVFASTAAVPPGPPSAADAPVDAAAKNGIGVLRHRTGWAPSRKLAHVPYPQRRSVLHEIEEAVPEAVAATTAARFRSPSDLSLPSFLGPYYALATGRAVAGDLGYLYVNIADRWAPAQLAALTADRDRDILCLNETSLDGARDGAVTRMVTRFLDGYFPRPSPFERG